MSDYLNRLLVIVLIALSGSLPLTVEAEQFKVLRVVWQKDLEGGIPEGYVERGMLFGEDLVKDEPKFVSTWASMRGEQVVRIELVEKEGDKLYHVAYLYNLKAEEEEGKRIMAVVERLLITDDIGPYKNVDPNPKGAPSRFNGFTYFDHDYELIDAKIYFRHESASPHVDQLQISVGVTESLECPISDHQFLRYSIREDPKMLNLHGQWVIHSMENHFDELSWKSGDHYCVRVDGGGKEGSETVAKRYLEKYPSTLPKDFKIDKEEWGREEVKIWLGRMKRTLDDWEKIKNDIIYDSVVVKGENVYYSMNACINWLAFHGAELPLGKDYNLMKELNFEESNQVYEYLSAWWKEYGPTAYWDVRHQMLRTRYPRQGKSGSPFK